MDTTHTQKLAQQQEHIKQLEEALYHVLDSNRLDIAKEHAAEALGEELEEYLERDLIEIDFMDNDFDGSCDYSLIEETT